jgi:hypothetical protein
LAEAAIRSGLGANFITAHDLAADLRRACREGLSFAKIQNAFEENGMRTGL